MEVLYLRLNEVIRVKALSHKITVLLRRDTRELAPSHSHVKTHMRRLQGNEDLRVAARNSERLPAHSQQIKWRPQSYNGKELY